MDDAHIKPAFRMEDPIEIRQLLSGLFTAAFLTITSLGADAEYPKSPRETVVASPETVALLKRYLSSDNPAERSAALGVLRQVRDPAMAGEVRKLLKDPDTHVRAQTLVTLEALLAAPELVPILREQCKDAAPQVARQALGILRSVPGPEAFDTLVQLRSEIASDFVETWSRALAGRPEPVPTAIVEELLRDKNPFTRAAGAQIVVRQPGTIELTRRIALLEDPAAQVRVHAIETLRESKDDPEIRRAIGIHLNDSSSLVRRAAIDWLAGSLVDLQAIESRFDDVDPTVRIAAVNAAGRIGDGEAATKLVERLGDREVLVARAASDQLVTIGGDALADTLLGTLKDRRDQVAGLSARTLGLMKHIGAIDHLERITETASDPVRIAAYEAIGQIGQSRVVPWLFERVDKETGYPRAAINEAFGRLKDSRAVDHLLADCQYPEEKSKGLNPALFTGMGGPPPYPTPATAVATAAVRALGEIGEARAVPALVEVSRDVLRDEAFWTGVMESLAKLGDVSAKPALLELGVSGVITQGLAVANMPTGTRSAALRGLATLGCTDAVDEILAITPGNCVLELRQVAAEVLTKLTGHTYTYRLPVRFGEFFIEDRGAKPDLSEFKRPIFYRVNEP